MHLGHTMLVPQCSLIPMSWSQHISHWTPLDMVPLCWGTIFFGHSISWARYARFLVPVSMRMAHSSPGHCGPLPLRFWVTECLACLSHSLMMVTHSWVTGCLNHASSGSQHYCGYNVTSVYRVMVIRNHVLARSVLMGEGETGGIPEAKYERHHGTSKIGTQNQVDIHSNRICVPECWSGHFKNSLYANDSWIYKFFPDSYIYLPAWHYCFYVIQNWCSSETELTCSPNLTFLQSSPSEMGQLHSLGAQTKLMVILDFTFSRIPHRSHQQILLTLNSKYIHDIILPTFISGTLVQRISCLDY